MHKTCLSTHRLALTNRGPQAALGLLATLLLSACFGGGDDEPPARGALIENPPQRLATLSATDLQNQLNATPAGQALLQVTQTPKCGVDVHYINYGTVGGKAESTTATGALMVPTGTDAACSGARPIVLYAHGTNPTKTYNLADIGNPSNAGAGEGTLLAAMYAAQGFIVVAPNYAGYDKSPLGYHPYLLASQQSKDMIDALSAARQALPSLPRPATDSGKLYITGYSQGGHVALATHRAMQSAGMTVTASVGQSGPYALSALVDAAFGGSPNLGGTIFTPLLTTSWQKAYGNIYTTPTDFYNTSYASGIDTLLPSTLSQDQLLSTGKLPALALFDNDVANFSLVAPQFQMFYGAPGTGLAKTSYVNTVLADLQANPCPHTTLSAPLNCSPTNTFRQAAKANDLRNWTPVSPVLLCGGKLDPSVFFDSTLLTQGYFQSSAGPLSTPVVDLELAATGTDSPVTAAAKTGFANAKQQTAAQAAAAASAAGGDAAAQTAAATQAVFLNYHGTLVPPFCNLVAREFFQTH